MPFEIVRNDIVNMQVDAIVNTANPRPVIGSGVDSAIHAAAGPELLKAREAVGELVVGEVAETPAFALPAKYVLHTAGPVWVDGTHREEELLRACYKNALERAAELGCESIAFPLLSTGNYGFPKDLALQVAIQEFGAFLLQNDMLVYLVVFGEEAYRLSSSLFSSVQSYIDENYVSEKTEEEYAAGTYHVNGNMDARRREDFRRQEAASLARPELLSEASFDTIEFDAIDASIGAPIPASPSAEPETLEDMIRGMDATFSDTLMALIDATGQKPSAIYNRANVSKQVFSKINSNSHYQPSKTTVIGFCMALELTLEEAQALLAKAGYTLSNSILFDVVVASFLARGNYDIMSLNIALFDRDLPMVGAK